LIFPNDDVVSDKKNMSSIASIGKALSFALLACVFLLHVSPVSAVTRTSPLIINHDTIAQFDSLSNTEIANAAALRVLVRHASVGWNIRSGLDKALSTNAKYNWSKWTWQDRGNPGFTQKINDLITQTAQQKDAFDIFTMKLCYIDAYDSDFNAYRQAMDSLEANAAYQSKSFIWWTMPIMTNESGNAVRYEFNAQVRSYAAAHNKILYDIADIESHDPSGNFITYAINGTPYEALYQAYTTDGGHLNATDANGYSVGGTRAAKAFWVMMARIAQGQTTNSPTSTPSPTPIATPGDATGDGEVDGQDYVVWLNHYGQHVTGASNGNFNGDTVVDGQDYVVWLNNYGK
jgi:hypothetical protein